MDRIRVGISSCLMGAAVRYDGGDKRSVLCLDDLGAYFDFVPDCPELGAGLGVPRAPVRLVGDPTAPRAVGVSDATLDVTGALQRYAAQRMPALDGLCGYIFIRNSPSCGLYRVKVHGPGDMAPRASGRGLFAAAFTATYPQVPVEEEGRLRDPVLRDSFLTRVVVLHAWRQWCTQILTAARLRDFHARCALLLRAREVSGQGDMLERLLDHAMQNDPRTSGSRYFTALMAQLRHGATRRGHVAVLRHLQAHQGDTLALAQREELAEAIDRYGRGSAPLALPLAALRKALTPSLPELANQLYLRLAPPDVT